jgi:hypothetical protein
MQVYKKDVTGQKFGRLTVVRFSHKDPKFGRSMWECLCECGNTTIVAIQGLSAGSTRSCGCLTNEARIRKCKARFQDQTGKKFGRLTAIQHLGSRNKKVWYLFRCECGTEKEISINHVKSGRTVSCGCVGRTNAARHCTTHNQSRNPLYFVWAGMMQRCYDTDFVDYHNYGGRGITVCEEWHRVENFVRDMTPGYQKGLQLDRERNDEGYSKENCRWVTHKQNNRNKRDTVYLAVGGVTRPVIEWAELTSVPYSSILSRVKRGHTGHYALYGRKQNHISPQ